MAEPLQLRIRVDDKGTVQVNKFNATLGKTGTALTRARSLFTRFSATLARVRGAFGRLSSALLSFRGLIAGLGLVLLIRRIIRLVNEMTEAIDVMSKRSRNLGITTESLSALGLAAEFASTEFERVIVGFRRFTKQISDASTGLKESVELFSDLDISIRDSTGSLKSADELLGDVAERFSKLEDGINKAAVANELFGRGGLELVTFLNQGREGIDKMREAAEFYGVSISTQVGRDNEEFRDSLVRMDNAIKGIKLTLLQDFVPALTDGFNKLAIFIAVNRDDIVAALREIIPTVEEFIDTLGDLIDILSTLSKLAKLAFNGIKISILTVSTVAESLKFLFVEIRRAVFDLAHAITEGLLGAAISVADFIADNRRLVAAANPMLALGLPSEKELRLYSAGMKLLKKDIADFTAEEFDPRISDEAIREAENDVLSAYDKLMKEINQQADALEGDIFDSVANIFSTDASDAISRLFKQFKEFDPKPFLDKFAVTFDEVREEFERTSDDTIREMEEMARQAERIVGDMERFIFTERQRRASRTSIGIIQSLGQELDAHKELLEGLGIFAENEQLFLLYREARWLEANERIAQSQRDLNRELQDMTFARLEAQADSGPASGAFGPLQGALAGAFAFESGTSREAEIFEQLEMERQAINEHLSTLRENYSMHYEEIQGLEAQSNNIRLKQANIFAQTYGQVFIGLFQSLNNSISQYMQATGSKSKELLIVQKALAISIAIMQTYLAAIGIYANVLTQPGLGPGALALGKAMMALAIATGLANVAIIAATPISYHTGGYVDGKQRRAASDEVDAVLQRGEYVVSRSGVDFLDAINKGMMPAAAGSGGGGGGDRAVFVREEDMFDVLNSSTGRQQIMKIVREERGG